MMIQGKIFSFCYNILCCGSSLELPHRGSSVEGHSILIWLALLL